MGAKDLPPGPKQVPKISISLELSLLQSKKYSEKDSKERFQNKDDMLLPIGSSNLEDNKNAYFRLCFWYAAF